MYFCVNEFEVGVNDSILSSNEQQNVYKIRVLQNILVSKRTEQFIFSSL